MSLSNSRNLLAIIVWQGEYLSLPPCILRGVVRQDEEGDGAVGTAHHNLLTVLIHCEIGGAAAETEVGQHLPVGGAEHSTLMEWGRGWKNSSESGNFKMHFVHWDSLEFLVSACKSEPNRHQQGNERALLMQPSLPSASAAWSGSRERSGRAA